MHPTDHPQTPRSILAMGSRIVGVALFALLFAFWVIFLAGIGAQQDACVSGQPGSLASRGTAAGGSGFKPQLWKFTGGLPCFNLLPGTGLVGYGNCIVDGNGVTNPGLYPEWGRRRLMAKGSVADCGAQLGLHWWVLFLNLFLLLAAAAMATGSRLVLRLEALVRMGFAFNTALLTTIAHGEVTAAYSLSEAKVTGAGLSATRATAAGAVSLAMLNMVWIVCASDAHGSLVPKLPWPCGSSPSGAGPENTAGASQKQVDSPSEEGVGQRAVAVQPVQ